MRSEWSIVKNCVFDSTWLQVKLYWTMTKEIVFTRTMRFLWDLKMTAVSLPKRHQRAYSDVRWKHSVLTRDHCERSEMNNDTGDIIKIIPLFKQQQKKYSDKIFRCEYIVSLTGRLWNLLFSFACFVWACAVNGSRHFILTQSSSYPEGSSPFLGKVPNCWSKGSTFPLLPLTLRLQMLNYETEPYTILRRLGPSFIRSRSICSHNVLIWFVLQFTLLTACKLPCRVSWIGVTFFHESQFT